MLDKRTPLSERRGGFRALSEEHCSAAVERLLDPQILEFMLVRENAKYFRFFLRASLATAPGICHGMQTPTKRNAMHNYS